MSSQEGFLFGELSDFKQRLMQDIKKEFPEETKKFIKAEAKACMKVVKKVARKEVGKWIIDFERMPLIFNKMFIG